MSITPKDPADFTPSMGAYKNLQPFRYWCQKVLPLVYDDSLSYYELLCKVVDYLNKTMEDVETLHDDVDDLHDAYVQLQTYVNDYFSTLDVQQEINNKLDIMVSDGTLDTLLLPYFNAYKDEINEIVETQNENINTQNERIEVLEGRMDTFASLPDGSTSGDAELLDIRVGANGTVYSSAGNAVRGQIEDVTSALSDIIDKNAHKMTRVSLNGYLDKTHRSANVTDVNNIINIPLGSYAYYGINLYDLGITEARLKLFVLRGNGNKILLRISPSFNQGTNIQMDTVGNYYYKDVTVDSTNKYLTIRMDNTSGFNTEELIVGYLVLEKKDTVYIGALNEGKTLYVSPLGNDNNSGSYDTPLASIDRALNNGAETIKIFGGVYEQNIDISKFSGETLNIKTATINGRVQLYAPNSLLTNSETLASGYTKVYYATITRTISSNVSWLYQDGVADTSTLISDAERLPLERGLAYRCDDTKIIKCSANNLASALSEIENADDYRWYLDGSTLYFSRPDAVNASQPIRYADRWGLFQNVSDGRKLTINMCGIECKYQSINISQTVGSTLTDCKASNCCDIGAIVFSSSLGATLVRCEAANNRYGSIGDGFNGSSTNTGDAKTRQNTCTMVDCWSHDNYDDGYSTHERSEISVYGGLFEYNGKAGITPSYGCHINCYNVVARNNKSGFLYVGTVEPEEGGKYGQMLCFGCLSAYNNKDGGFNTAYGVTGQYNRVELVNCYAINNRYVFYSETYSVIDVHNCYVRDNTNVSSGSGTINISNCDLLTSA